MLSSLLYRLRGSHLGWRGTLLAYWLKDNIGFALMLAAPILALGAIGSFAYLDGKSVEAKRQRQIAEAQHRRAIDLRCLAENIYFEARGEPLEGQFAVAEVTLNRVASPNFPDTICEVVHETRWDAKRKRNVAHFSWTALQLKLGLSPSSAAWEQAMTVATAAYDRKHTPRVPGALFFHATYVNPYWAKGKKRIARIGNHIFYR